MSKMKNVDKLVTNSLLLFNKNIKIQDVSKQQMLL